MGTQILDSKISGPSDHWIVVGMAYLDSSFRDEAMFKGLIEGSCNSARVSCSLLRPLIKIVFFGSLWLCYDKDRKEFLRRLQYQL